MRPIHVILLMAIFCLCGCTAQGLRERMISQGATLPELEYQQVLDNIALFAINPEALPGTSTFARVPAK